MKTWHAEDEYETGRRCVGRFDSFGGAARAYQHQRWVECSRKRAHSTHQEAVAHQVALARRYDDHVQVYRCRFGAHWHVGHAPAV